MSSNSSQMTLEEKLVQTIKTTALASLVDDDDAITELTRRAVNEALYAERRNPDTGWAARTMLPSPAVQAAEAAATRAANAIVAEMVDHLKVDPEFIKLCSDAFTKALSDAIRQGAYNAMVRAQEAAVAQSMNALGGYVRTHGGKVPGQI